MKRIPFIFFFFLTLAALNADELMAGLKDASDQVAQDIVQIIGEDSLYAGAIAFENRPVILGDLFSDLLSNRLLGNNNFKGTIVKGYSSMRFRLNDAQWILSGSLYKIGDDYFLILYLNNSEGQQKKGWEFLFPTTGTEPLMRSSRIATTVGWDRYEPNDSEQAAVEVKPDPQEYLEGLEIGASGDEDWFYIDVDQVGNGNSLNILSAYTTGEVDTYIEIYGPNEATDIVAENDDGNDSNASVNFALTEAGRWFIKVKGYTSEDTGEYGLHVAFTTKQAGPGEPDNSTVNASPLLIEGTPLDRIIDYPDDYDYFRIVVDRDIPSNEALVVETSGGLDLAMTLLDDEEHVIVSNDDSGVDGNPRIMIPVMKSGVYYAVVYLYDAEDFGEYSIRAYTMQVEKDEYEDDNTMDDAREIQINGQPQERTFMPADEEDWAKIVVDTAGDFIIKTTGPIDTYLALYDSHGEFLYEDDDSGSDNNALLSETLDEGIYYLLIVQYEDDENEDDSYFLSVKKY